MFGISWGGFNSIQMAARNPPALKAIVAIDATEDLFQDDVHFMDGIMHLDSWEMSMDLDNTRPGAPDYVIDDANFRDRFDTEPWMLTYKFQQRDGPFWDRASVRDRYEDIRIPTFHIGGWYDGYRDSVPRMLANVKNAPVKAIVGAWHHTWPNEPYPGPGMEWRHEAVRWFDQFLKGEDTGILDEPRFAVFVRDWHPPGPQLDNAPGKWRYEDGWPIARIRDEVLYPQPNHTLGAEAPAATTHQLRYIPSIGVEAGGPVMWWGDVAHDQRGTDAFSLVYDTEPLADDLEILGLPLATLTVAANATRANWFARLSDVAPDGTVTQVAGAAMNGTHRDSAREPRAIVPGEPFELAIEMHFTSWVFPKGHRIRLAVNNAQWPMLWPTPEPMTTELRLGASRLSLPVVPFEQRPVPDFLPPAKDPQYAGYESLEGGTTSGYGEISSVDRNPPTGTAVAKATNGGGTRFPWGTERTLETIRYEVKDDAPADAQVLGTHRMEVELPGRTLVWDAELFFPQRPREFPLQLPPAAAPRTASCFAKRPGPEPYRGITSDETHEPRLSAGRFPPASPPPRSVGCNRGPDPADAADLRADRREDLHRERRAKLGGSGRDQGRAHRVRRHERGRQDAHRQGHESRRPEGPHGRAGIPGRARPSDLRRRRSEFLRPQRVHDRRRIRRRDQEVRRGKSGRAMDHGRRLAHVGVRTRARSHARS